MNETEIPTPRTDEEARAMSLDCDDSCVEIYIKRDGKAIDGDFVMAGFARQLERELINAKDELDSIINVIPSDAPCLHYETGDHIADYVLGLQKEVRDAHALYFNILAQNAAMREVIRFADQLLAMKKTILPAPNSNPTSHEQLSRTTTRR